MENSEKVAEKWNSLTSGQKAAFGDRYITNESNLRAWDKPFNELSYSKKRWIMKSSIEKINPEDLNYVKGYGI